MLVTTSVAGSVACTRVHVHVVAVVPRVGGSSGGSGLTCPRPARFEDMVEGGSTAHQVEDSSYGVCGRARACSCSSWCSRAPVSFHEGARAAAVECMPRRGDSTRDETCHKVDAARIEVRQLQASSSGRTRSRAGRFDPLSAVQCVPGFAHHDRIASPRRGERPSALRATNDSKLRETRDYLNSN